MNKVDSFIHSSSYHSSHFVGPRRIVREKLKILKNQPPSDALTILHSVNEALAKDHQLTLRLNWEEKLTLILRKKEVWQDVLQSVKDNPSLRALYQQWNKNLFFQYHSSAGLLFLLMVCVTYQQHFRKAYQELQQNQRFWFSRIPFPIAKNYQGYLSSYLEDLQKWRSQTVDMLLFRLKIAEQKKEVTFDDVSYSLLKPVQELGQSLNLKTPLFSEYFVREASTFHKMQQAIATWGDAGQKSQLLQFSWYKPYPKIARKIMLIKKDEHLLWSPLSLAQFFPKYGIKFFYLFQFMRQRFLFLEDQQALLAQWIICRKLTLSTVKTNQSTYRQLLACLLCDELFQQALAQLSQQPYVPWWQRFEQSLQKEWFSWLNCNLKKNRVILYESLNTFFSEISVREDIVENLDEVKQLINKIKVVLPLYDENKNPLLLAFQNKINDMELWQRAQEKRLIIKRKEDELMKAFKQELTKILNDYEQEHQFKRQRLSQVRQENLYFLHGKNLRLRKWVQSFIR